MEPHARVGRKSDRGVRMTLSTTSPGDEREAARTTAIAYPDADLSCGLSTDGILICGDEKSINRVRNALHAESGTVPALRAELLEARAALSSSTVQQVGAEWMPIETAPKDGRDFIALVGGLPYMAHYDEFGRMVRMTHCNRRGYGRSYTTHQVDGKALIEILSEGEDDSYEVQGILWARNFNHKPTHWMPLPSFPSLF
jgi:hypothetical protein